MAHPSMLCYHSLCSMLGAVERDFVPSVGVHPEHRVTSDHEHQLELGCSGSDHHHLFPSFDSYCKVYALIRDRRKQEFSSSPCIWHRRRIILQGNQKQENKVKSRKYQLNYRKKFKLN